MALKISDPLTVSVPYDMTGSASLLLGQDEIRGDTKVYTMSRPSGVS